MNYVEGVGSDGGDGDVSGITERSEGTLNSIRLSADTPQPHSDPPPPRSTTALVTLSSSHHLNNKIQTFNLPISSDNNSHPLTFGFRYCYPQYVYKNIPKIRMNIIFTDKPSL